MSDQHLVSVIIPIHDCEEFLPRCVQSVFEQTHGAVELVFVDDGSSDSCPALIKRYAAESPDHVSVVAIAHESARGVSATRNTGVAAATGEFLFFIDGDDWIEPDCLAVMVAAAKEHDLEVCCGTHEYYYDETNRQTDQDAGGSEALYERNAAVLRALSERTISTFTWNKLMKRTLFTERGLCFEESILNDEDKLWSFRLVMRAERWMTLAKLSYHYRKNNPDSITAKSFTSKRLGNYYRVLDLMRSDVVSAEVGPPRARFVAKAVHNFTKSILWHIELDGDADFRALYGEFSRNNVLRRDSDFYRNLRGRDRFLAWGWELPYPWNRWMSPYYLRKLGDHGEEE